MPETKLTGEDISFILNDGEEQMTEQNNKPVKMRSSNIELYRIFVMLLIILHHYLVNSDLFLTAMGDPDSGASWIAFVIGAYGKMGINCFVLITGYYMCRKKISLRKYLLLLFEVWFYSILLMIIDQIFGLETINLDAVVYYMFLTQARSIQFVASFLLFYPLIPFLNILIRNLDFARHTILISLLLFIFTIRANIPDYVVSLNYVFWFCVIYLIGAYLNIYNDRFASFTGDWRKMLAVVLALFVVSVFAVKQGMMLTAVSKEDLVMFNMMDSNKVIPVLLAVVLFLFFKSIRVPDSRFINLLGKATFGILILHTSFGSLIWNTLRPDQWYGSAFIILHALACALGVFAACAVVDIIRIYLFEKPLFRLIGEKVDHIEQLAVDYCRKKLTDKQS